MPMFKQAASELAAIVEQLGVELYVVYADYTLQKVDHFYPGDKVTFEPKGGGGTRFTPPFDWVEKECLQPSCLLYYTDLCGWQFPQEPGYPVLWMRTGGVHYATPPFGDIIDIE